MKRHPAATPAKITFITGTDTGVGKTTLTGLLLAHLRGQGVRALAMKPFCTGPRNDAEMLQALQHEELTVEEVNPFYYRKPLAPLAAATREGQLVSCEAVIEHIHAAAQCCEHLLVEGVGGVLVPLGDGYSVADLIERLGCDVIVVSRNQLGTLNHTLLSLEALAARQVKRLKLVLVAQCKPDASAVSNSRVLKSLIGGIPLISLENLVGFNGTPAEFNHARKKLKKTLARILE